MVDVAARSDSISAQFEGPEWRLSPAGGVSLTRLLSEGIVPTMEEVSISAGPTGGLCHGARLDRPMETRVTLGDDLEVSLMCPSGGCINDGRGWPVWWRQRKGAGPWGRSPPRSP
jgi:hypothetical protein